MAQILKTYGDIISAVREALGVQSSDLTATNKIKRLINMVYLDEVVPHKRWRWLEKETTVVHEGYYATGLAAATHDSTTITLDTAPNVSLGSFAGYRFSLSGQQDVYTVASHTAGSATLTLTNNYIGITSTDKAFKLWRDKVNLPTDAKETVDITHSKHADPLKAKGWQEMNRIITANPKGEGYPAYYSTRDFYDPTPSTSEEESDRYRQVELYPAITLNPVTLQIKYIVEPTELSLDTDEPVMPIGDRIVLYYGALSHAWGIISRDIESQQLAQNQYMMKLARMAGEIEDGFDKPSVGVKSGYLSTFRKRGLLNRRNLAQVALAGESSYRDPTYAKNIVIEGATVTANFTVNDGVLIDGRDLSVDGEALDSLLLGVEVTLTDNTTNQVVATWEVANYNVITIDYGVKRGSAYEAGQIKIITDGTSASVSNGAIATLGDPGVTFTADIDGSTVRLLSTTTSTGTDANMTYTEIKVKI